MLGFFQLSPDANDRSAYVFPYQKSRLVFPANSVHLCKAQMKLQKIAEFTGEGVVPFLIAAPLMLFAECCSRAVPVQWWLPLCLALAMYSYPL